MKRALLIGINYTGMTGELKGCINDICDIYRLLKDNGYTYFSILADSILPSEIIYNRYSSPTRENIISYIKNLISSTIDGDHIYIHYSGHGSQINTLYGEEHDSMNEVLVPLDYTTSGFISDNYLRTIIINPLLEKKVKLRIILDCCHSGTALDLKYNLYLNNKDIKKDNLNIEDINKEDINKEDINKDDNKKQETYVTNNVIELMVKEQIEKILEKYIDKSIIDKYMKKIEINNSLELIESIDNNKNILSLTNFYDRIDNNNNIDKKIKLDVLMLSGCKDEQTSADATFNNRANGALTTIFINIYRKYMTENNIKNVVYFLRELQDNIKKSGFNQIPQLSSETVFTQYRLYDL